MNAPNACRSCNGQIAPGSQDTLCPRCLLMRAVSAEVPSGGEPGTLGPEERAFGDYELVDEIAHGGQGIVYKARQKSLGRVVAIKMLLLGPMANADYVQRFRFEAVAAGSLRHPNIVRIHEVGLHDGQPFIVMEFIEGQSLARHLANGPLPARRAAEYLHVIADAVHCAHESGILHRDLKPSNVLIDFLDQPHVTDFGLARRLDGDGGVTMSGQMLGSPNYIPPEQAVSKRGTVGRPSDVYGLGAVLYHLLTGRPPFAGDSIAETIDQTLNSDLVAPRLLNRSIPADLEVICLKCLEKEPPKRYPTAAELRDDLKRFLAGEPIRARPLGSLGRAWRWCRRKPALASALAGLVAAMVLGVAGIAWQGQRARSSAAASQATLLRQFVANGNRVAAEGDYSAALPWFTRALELETDPRRIAMHRLRIGALLQLSPRLVQAWTHDGPVLDVQFSPDGRLLAASSEAGTTRVWDTTTGELALPVLTNSSPVGKIRFSPDGRRLLTASRRDLPDVGSGVRSGVGDARLWDARSGALIAVMPHTAQVEAIDFSPDGRRFLAGSHDTRTYYGDSESGQILGVLTNEGPVFELRFDPAGRRAIICGFVANQSRNVGALWDLASGRRLGTFDDVEGKPHFNSAGTQLIASHSFGGVGFWDLESGASRRLIGNDKGTDSTSVSIRADGRRLVRTTTTYHLDVFDLEAKQLLHSLRYPIPAERSGYPFTAMYSPDGRFIATACEDHTARVWEAGDGRPTGIVLRHSGPVMAVVFGPESRRLATAGLEGRVKLWDLASSQSVQPVFRQHLEMRFAGWSPNGSRILTGGQDAAAGVWDPRDGRLLTPGWLQHEWAYLGIVNGAWSADGNRLVTAGGDSRFRVWDAQTWQPITGFIQPTNDNPFIVQLTPDGRRVVTAGRERIVRVFDVDTGREVPIGRMAHESFINFVLLSSDGRYIVTHGSDGVAQVWNATNGAAVSQPMRHRELITAGVHATNTALYASGASDGTARVWSFPDGSPVSPWLRHSATVRSVAFNPAGTRMLTASADRTAVVWDPRSGRRLLSLPHAAAVNEARYNHDGSVIGTASDAGARLWDAETGEPLTPWLRLERSQPRARGIQFHPKDNRFLVHPGGAEGGLGASLFDLQTDLRPSPELSSLVGLLSGLRVEDSGELVDASSEASPSQWVQLKASRAAEVTVTPEQARQWHRAQAGLAHSMKMATTAEVHSRFVLAENPADMVARNWLGAALRLQGRGDEAAATGVDVIPARVPELDPDQLDLGRYFNLRLHDHEAQGAKGSLCQMTTGRFAAGGISYDVRGMIQLNGLRLTELGFDYPTRIEGVPVNRRARRLHILHGISWPADPGVEVARYRLHYADGDVRVLPVLRGVDVSDHWFPDDPAAPNGGQPQASHADVVWRGASPDSKWYHSSTCLEHRAYDNPRPDVRIVSLDFESAMTTAAPYLLAITLEPDDGAKAARNPN